MPQHSPMAGSVDKESACIAEDTGDSGSILGSGRFPPKEENGNPLQYSCLKNPWAEKPERLTVQRGAKGSKESNMTEQLNTHHCAPGCVLSAGDAVVRKTGRNPRFPVAFIHVCVCEREKQQMNNLQVIK